MVNTIERTSWHWCASRIKTNNHFKRHLNNFPAFGASMLPPKPYNALDSGEGMNKDERASTTITPRMN
jgi:hypothetical protein